ncbi:DUF5658 family protein [Paenibacillus sp. D51F]
MQARTSMSVTGFKSRNAIAKWLLLVLSVFDAIATDAGIRLHAIQEANPFAALLYETHPALFYGYKIVLPSLLLLMGGRTSSILLSRLILFAAVVYALLAAYHLAWIVLAAGAG